MNSEMLSAPKRLDAAHADMLEHQIDENIRSGRYDIELSLRDTVFLSSAGIRALLIGNRKLRDLGGSLHLTKANDAVRKVIETSGLSTILDSHAAHVFDEGPGRNRTKALDLNSIHFEIEHLPDKAPNPVSFIGSGRFPAARGPDENALTKTRVTPQLCGVGLGAFGVDNDSRAERIGEWTAACGVAFSLPPDSRTADYITASSDYQPENHLLYAACFEGAFSRAARFGTGQTDEVAKISDLIDSAVSWSGTQQIGVLMACESAGLVGAAITSSPLSGRSVDFFAHPEVRERVSFTPEPEYNGETALVVGIAGRGEPEQEWKPFVRPIDARRSIYAHLHAAVFSYAAIPAGSVQPGGLVRRLAEREKIHALLHLLTDTREDADKNESGFRSGLIWTCPLAGRQKELTS